MRNIGDFIDTYRIVWKQENAESRESYLVERATDPGLLYYLQVEARSSFSGSTDYNSFIAQMGSLQKIRELYIHRLIDFGADEEGHPYFVYPEATLGQKSLKDRLQTGGVRPDDARRILTRVGMALVLAHQQGIVHGFFSPSSVLWIDDSDVRVFAFLSSALNTAAMRAELPQAYRFPEKNASRQSDQYALAALAQELLLPPENLPENASALRQAIVTAQSTEPGQRFASVREFLRQLGIELALPSSELEKEVSSTRSEADARSAFSSAQTKKQTQSAFTGSTQQTYAGTTASFSTAPGSKSTSPAAKRPASSRRGCLITLLCILLIPLLIILHTFLPASAATVTITPVDQKFEQLYQLTEASQTNLAAQQFGGRTLTYETKTNTKSTHISKKTFVEGSAATGKLVFSQISSNIYLDLYTLTIDVGNGVSLKVDDTTTVMKPGHTYTVPVHATENGAKGNLPAGYVNDYYSISEYGLVNTSSQTAYIANPNALKGGKDDYNGPVVSADEVNPLESSLLSQEEEEAQKFFQAQLKPREALLANFSCTPTHKVQPGLDAHSANVKVTSFANCAVGVYDQDELNAALNDAAHKLALQRLDSHFALLQPAQITVTNAGTISAGSTTFAINLVVNSNWRLLLDARGKQAMQQALAGLSQDDALALLKDRYKSRQSRLDLSWFWGGHMPADTSSIQIVAHYLPS